jgi:hypothetical protein
MPILSILLQILPGPFDDMPTQGFDSIDHMHDKIANISWILFAAMAVIGGGIVVIGIMTSKPMNPVHLLLRLVLIAVMLVVFKPIFSTVTGIGLDLSFAVLTKEEQQQITQSINKTAPKDDSGTPTTEVGWIVAAAKFISGFTLDPGRGLTGIIIALADILFFISFMFMSILWMALIIILYVLGPLAIAFGAIPGWGDRFVSSWFGSLIQLSLWPTLLAFIAWMVINANSMFLVSGSQSVLPNFDAEADSLTSAVLALMFALMTFATPFIIAFAFPISRTSQLGHYAFALASNKASAMAGGATRTAGMLGGAAVGGPAGAAGGGGSDATQKIASPVGGSGASRAA